MLLLRLPELIVHFEVEGERADERLMIVRDQTVLIDATRTASATPSLAADLVWSLLSNGGARQLVVIGGPEPFTTALWAAAELQTGCQEYVHLYDAEPLPAVAGDSG